jgi:hypothetical protein
VAVQLGPTCSPEAPCRAHLTLQVAEYRPP